MPAQVSGYDSAATVDLLDRYPIARRVFQIATMAPQDWSVRIGVYGTWGSGKTSVLNHVEQLATAAGHRVEWFTPWGYSSTPAMWGAFRDKVARNLRAAGIPVKKSLSDRLPWARAPRVQRAIEAASEVHKVSRAALVAADLLNEFLSATADALADAVRTLGEHRLIVMVDDLDRADPKIVPDVLFGLRQVLDRIGGISWVLALDPEVVGRALERFHPGMGRGERFLEKIVEFPVRLVDSSSEQLSRLAIAEMGSRCPWFDTRLLELHHDLLPRNPRVLKAFVRHLWTLGAEVARRNPEDVDVQLLMLLSLLRTEHPRLFEHWVNDRAVLDNAVSLSVHLMFGRTDATRQKELHESIDLQLERSDVFEESRARAAKVLGLMVTGTFRTPERIQEHANLGVTPTLLTQRELAAYLAKSGRPPVKEWLASLRCPSAGARAARGRMWRGL
ncbi:MAG: P-loop NTPase fold protein, partial [Myxococcales bacterium]